MIRSSQAPFTRDSRFAEFLAVDFILDNDLRIWVLEVNFNPQILSVTPDRIIRNYKMIDVIYYTLKYINALGHNGNWFRLGEKSIFQSEKLYR